MRNQKTIAITGAQGFVGRSAVDGLLRAGHTVRALISPNGGPPYPPVRSWIQGDLRDLTVARELVRGCDAVIHCAGRGFPSDPVVRPDAQVRENLESTGQLLEAMVVENVNTLVATSSGGAIYAPAKGHTPLTEDHPLQFRSPYALTKIACENLITLYSELYGMTTTSLRLANPYGPGQFGRSRQGFLGVALKQASEGLPMPVWGSLDICKDFVFIEDLWDLFGRLVETPQKGTFNVGGGKGTTLGEALDRVRAVTGQTLEVEMHAGRSTDTEWIVLDSSRIEQATGWKAQTPLDKGLAKIWAEVRSSKAA